MNQYKYNMYQYQLGQVVLVKGEKIIGVVSYLGNVHWDSDHNKIYVGLTLSDPVENGHNGSLKGKKYFLEGKGQSKEYCYLTP